MWDKRREQSDYMFVLFDTAYLNELDMLSLVPGHNWMNSYSCISHNAYLYFLFNHYYTNHVEHNQCALNFAPMYKMSKNRLLLLTAFI